MMNNLNNVYEMIETNDSIDANNAESNNAESNNAESNNAESNNAESSKNDNRYKGKTVVLVDSDNPWYQNDTTVPMKYKHNELFYEDKNIYKQSLYVPYARASSCTKLDLCAPDLGLGHSQLDRDIKTRKMCETVENFNSTLLTPSVSDTTDKMNRNILILIFIILIGIFIYNKYKSQSQSQS